MAFDFLCRTILIFILFMIMANSEFAVFTCQKEVSVCKNKQVEIICNSTQGFHLIELYFCKSQKSKGQLLFNMTTVGETAFQKGKHLKLESQETTLVIENTQLSDAGFYRWRLLGKGSSNIYTKLYVSEPPTISKENGSLICRATVIEQDRRITWSNDLPTGQSEFIIPLDASGLFELYSSQPWNDSFDSNPPCCKVVNEKGSQELCEETCYTSHFLHKVSGASMGKENNLQWIIIIIFAAVILALIGVIYMRRWYSPLQTARNCP
ncbi:uncharacterized protein LOC141514203 isoform X2 [Macrotis lagotis]|uniref:uncharacterized protein LOC141514203 isoform X2 n=1 Tax=Macrotis lagotis TaxID=92651 RepID=UPI003D691219